MNVARESCPYEFFWNFWKAPRPNLVKENELHEGSGCRWWLASRIIVCALSFNRSQSRSWKSNDTITYGHGVSFKPITKLRSRCVTRELRPCIWNFFWPVVLFCRQFIFRQNKTVTKNILTILRFPQELRSWRHRIVAGHQHSKVLTEPSRKTHEKQG